MSFLFFSSKYEKKHRLESTRELAIQSVQSNYKCSREYAVRYYDYTKHMLANETIKLASAGLYTFGAYKLLQAVSKDIPLVQKTWVKFPVLAAGFWLGRVMYDKLVSHYLNFEDMDVAHLWERDLAAKYGLKDVQEEPEIPLTPFERMKKDLIHDMDSLNLEGEKQFKRISKDKNDFYYMFGKIRNLENIIYLDEKEFEDIDNPIKLQMKIDSVKPTLKVKGDINKHIEDLQEKAEAYKYQTENSRNFRSIKDKFLGLPFMLKRHQQYPTPVRGTWQFDLFEQIFGLPYDLGLGDYETQEKINKFNYHLFLHPSVIEKYDTNSEEFDMYLRKLNVESATLNENRAKCREYFCKSILPILNLAEDKETGVDFANYVINKSKSNPYNDYLYEQYSGQKEEKLFREAEESKYIDKNQPFVQTVAYNNVDKERIGIRAKELEELLSNPTKTKNMRRALEARFPYYEPTKIVDHLKFDANIKNYYNTIIDREIDTTSPDFKIEDLNALQNDRGEGGDNPEEEALMMFHINRPGADGIDNNNNPYFIDGKNYFAYNSSLDWNDYAKEDPHELSFIAPKKQRFELRGQMNFTMLHSLYYRNFNSLEFADRVGYVVPYLDYKNEELKQRVLFRSNYHRFLNNLKLRDSDKEKLEFLENKSMDDSYAISDDVTEEELDQALFESTYSKPIFETDEYRGKTF